MQDGRRIHYLAGLFMTALFAANVTGAQQPRSRPIGALQATGEVWVNDSRIAQDWTVFAGDRVRTGAGGVAAISVTGFGTLVMRPGSSVSFRNETPFLSVLEQGSVTLRALADSSGFRIRLNNFVLAPVPPAESVAEIERGADGSFLVTCSRGTLGLIEVGGSRSLFLDATESATIRADGSLQQRAAPERAPSAPAPRTQKGQRAWLPWVLAGAGAAGAAAALAGRRSESRPPVSPLTP